MINKEKLVLLHSIRGFAALIVVIAHAKFPFWSGGQEFVKHLPRTEWSFLDYVLFGIDMFTSNATAMVIVFFVLSGFFIAYSFESNGWQLKHFYTNRFIRIYTPYLGSIIFTLVLFKASTIINPELFTGFSNREYNQAIINANTSFDISSLFYTMLFISKPSYIGFNYPYWSLLIEAMFYIIAPFFINRSKWFLIISSVFMLLAFCFEPRVGILLSFKPFRLFITTYMFYFALGYFIFWLLFKYKIQLLTSFLSRWVKYLIPCI
jgi:peptidoglycan/LPS O-acetylase OafA/YrhL